LRAKPLVQKVPRNWSNANAQEEHPQNDASLGEDSQNVLCKLVRFILTLSLKILRLFRLKVIFEADKVKG